MENTISISLSNLELTRSFFAIGSLLLFAHIFSHAFHLLRLPKLIGEIGGGLLLGPTVLGFFLPDVYNWLFYAFEAEGKLISIIYWIGLVFLMFISGFELQKFLDKEDKKIILALTLGSTVIPFMAGWIVFSYYDFLPYIGEKQNILALQIIIATATAITSVPVISRIFMDLGMLNTHFAKIVLATASIHDVILWIALAIATGLVDNQSSSIVGIGFTVLVTVIFVGFSLLIMPILLNFLNNLEWNFLLKSSSTGYILFICFLLSAVASALDINVIFGALLAGVAVGFVHEDKFQNEIAHTKEISLAFFIPLYFAIVGLKMNLIHNLDINLLLFFFIFTTFFEMLGTIISSRFMKKDWLSSFNFGVAMTTRGGPGIVLATIAYDLGIINETFFITMVLNAIITSLLAGAWFRYLLHQGSNITT